MCPACIATAALVVAGTTSAGGLAAFVVKTFWAKSSVKNSNPSTPSTTTEGGTNGSFESRITR
jgi:hypothetical protein